MAGPTSPRIFDAQNTDYARRKVAAQARLYSDAKRWFYGRIGLIAVLAVASSVAALLTENSARTVIGGGGGLVLLLVSLVGGAVEKRTRMTAVAVQEEFDTGIFRLPWNDIEVPRPSPVTIGRAADRYTGNRDKNWYADTKDTHRPFDVLICQSSNLGWGAATHRIWAWTLVLLAALVLGLLVLIAFALGLTKNDVLVALVTPALAPLRELAEQVKANFDTAKAKEATEAKISTAWADGMAGKEIPSEEVLRTIQTKILCYRQQNPYVPDWLDERLRSKNEQAMRTTAADRVAEAVRHGHG